MDRLKEIQHRYCEPHIQRLTKTLKFAKHSVSKKRLEKQLKFYTFMCNEAFDSEEIFKKCLDYGVFHDDRHERYNVKSIKS